MSDSFDQDDGMANFPDGPTDGTGDEDRRWIVLYPDDYENHAIDIDGNVGVLVDAEQAAELHRLSIHALVALTHPDDMEHTIRETIRHRTAALEDEMNTDA